MLVELGQDNSQCRDADEESRFMFAHDEKLMDDQIVQKEAR